MSPHDILDYTVAAITGLLIAFILWAVLQLPVGGPLL